MPIYKKPEDKAGETVTIRLTGDERRMLDHLAALDEMTLTDFLRNMIAKRAVELQVSELPPRKAKRRPGRPKMARPLTERETTSITPPISADDVFHIAAVGNMLEIPPQAVDVGERTSIAPISQAPAPVATNAMTSSISQYRMLSESSLPSVFGDVIVRFRNSFVHRAEGTKRELEETITFLTGETGEGPILSLFMPLAEFTSERLVEVRQSIRDADVRLAKKNLYLTYLRMMLHFAVKEPDIDLRINPSRELPALSIIESEERRRFFIGQTE